MKIMAAGTSARLVEVEDHAEMLALYRGFQSVRRGLSPTCIIDVVPGARTLLIEFEPSELAAVELERLILNTSRDHSGEGVSEVVEIRVCYDGLDLDVTCDSLGLKPGAFPAWHTSKEWSVAFTGFAPGFGYLVRADHQLSVPRLEAPRTRVPAGSVAMAGVFTGLYPNESPGGWQIVGTTSHVLFDIEREPPAALMPGTRVRFVEVDRAG